MWACSVRRAYPQCIPLKVPKGYGQIEQSCLCPRDTCDLPAILIAPFNDGNALYLIIYVLLIAITMNSAANNLDSSLSHDPIIPASAPYPGSVGRFLLAQEPKHVPGRRSQPLQAPFGCSFDNNSLRQTAYGGRSRVHGSIVELLPVSSTRG